MSDYISQPTMNLRWKQHVTYEERGYARVKHETNVLQQEFLLKSVQDGSVTSEWKDVPIVK
jgi:hypothetical protein